MNELKTDNNTTFKIRKATKADLQDIQTLFVDAINAIKLEDYSAEVLKVWASSIENKERWLRKIKTQHFLIAEQETEIIGFASLEHHTHIDMLYTHKDFQRMAIAQTLFDVLEIEATKNNAANLTADVSITAKAFFEKNGFDTLSTKKNKIDGLEIINFKMRKELNYSKD
jgi:putative acetyltransferase